MRGQTPASLGTNPSQNSASETWSRMKSLTSVVSAVHMTLNIDSTCPVWCASVWPHASSSLQTPLDCIASKTAATQTLLCPCTSTALPSHYATPLSRALAAPTPALSPSSPAMELCAPTTQLAAQPQPNRHLCSQSNIVCLSMSDQVNSES